MGVRVVFVAGGCERAGAVPTFKHIRGVYVFADAVQVKLYNPNSTLSATSNKRFSFPNVYNYQGMNAIGMALNGFDMAVVNVLNFTVQPTYSYANNSFVVTLILDPASVSFNLLTYSLFTFNSNYNTLFDLQNQCTSALS